MTKVVVLTKSFSRASGGLASSLDLVNAMALVGVDVKIATTKQRPFTLSRTRVSDSSVLDSGKSLSLPVIWTAGRGRPSRYLLRRKLHSCQLQRGLRVGRLARAIADADFVIDCAGLSTESIKALQTVHGTPIILHHNGSCQAFIESFLSLDRRGADWTLAKLLDPVERYRFFLNTYDGVLFQAMDQQKEAEGFVEKNNKKYFSVTPSCTEVDILSLSNDHPIAELSTGKNIAVIGSIQPRKQQSHAIQAFKAITDIAGDWHLHFIGGFEDIEYFNQLDKQVGDFGLSAQVHFWGHRTDYVRFLQQCDIVMQTSKAEGVSRVLREAMFARKPIISYAIPGTVSILSEGEAVLCEPNSLDELSQGLRRLVINSDLQAQLSDQAYLRYLKQCSWSKYLCGIRDMVRYFAA